MLRPDKAAVPVSAITSVYKFYIYIAVLQCVFYYGTYYDGFMVDIR